MKSKSILFVFLLVQLISNAQVLKNVTVNLNNIGQVFDIKYIPTIQKYVAVGKFTQIDGATVNNIALLDENFNFVQANFPAVNDDIRCVEVINSTIYIGGKFTQVAGQTQMCLARLTIAASSTLPGTYDVTYQPTFNLLNSFSTAIYVADMDLNGGEIVAVGAFYDNLRNGILAFSAATGNLLNKFLDPNGINGFSDPLESFPALTVDKIGSNYVVAGPELNNTLYDNDVNGSHLMIFSSAGVNLTGNTLPSFHSISYQSSTYPNYRANEIAILNDSVIVSNLSHGSGYFIMGALNILNPDSYEVRLQSNLNSIGLHDASIITHNGDLICFPPSDIMQRMKLVSTVGSGTNLEFRMNPIQTNTMNNSFYGSNEPKMLMKSNNYLFLSSDNLNSVNGQARNGFAVFCLEPEDPKKMNNLYNVIVAYPNPQPFDLDTVVCAGNIKAYTLPPVNYATGYKWTFNGPGVRYYFAPNNSYVPTANDFLTSNNYLNGSINIPLTTSSTANKIWLMYDENFTGGELKVEPFNTCNSPTDYLYSKPATANLILAPLPNLQLADSLSLNCLVDTLHLVASSSTPNVSYTWENEFGATINNDSIQLNLASVTSVTFPRYFLATVKQNSGNMCSSSDSVFVDRSVIAPELALNSSLPIWNCYTDSLQVTVVDTNSLAPEAPIIYAWNYLDSTYSIPNVLTITNPNDSIAFVASYLSNGCSDTTQFVLSADLAPPVQQIEGFLSGFQTVGTITCSNDSLLVVLADNNGIDSDNFWIYQSDTIQDSLWVTINDPSYLIADSLNANLVTVTIDEYRFNPTNGCSTFGALAAVVFDIKQPSVIPFIGTASLTCSDTALQLNHTPTFGITNQGWLLPNGISNNADSIIATSAGNYVYAVEGANGCSNYDTVNVIQTTDLLFVSQPDTIVCPGSNFSLSAQAIGPGTMTYSWSNGSQTTSPNGIGGVDTLFIVQASNGLGCSGVDTLFARVTAPIEATFEAFSSCGAGGFIQVDSIYGGAAADINDYLFAFNGGAYSSNFSFPVSQIATYPLLIKDTLNCEYAFQTTITGVIETPDVNFLVSTYNQIGDTIALVNITDFSGFDGVFWTFPANLDVVSSYDSIAIFTAVDSGWYNIEFTGYILNTSVSPADTCFYPFQKTVYFGNYAINYGDSVVDNSISNVILFPNPINAGQAQTVTLSFTIASLQHYEVLFASSTGSVFSSVADEGDEVGEVVRIFNLPALAAGTYVFHILAEYGAKQVKLIVQ